MGSRAFTANGAWQSFVVPTGLERIDVTATGAGSGGRAGGLVSGRLAVTGGQVIWVYVGQQGKAHSGSVAGSFSGSVGATGLGGAGGAGISGAGGDGGGGATVIRSGSTTGSIQAVAGGAGGTSGDGGLGGLGGAESGGPGLAGISAGGAVGNATGGTQTQGGNGATSSYSFTDNGVSAPDAPVSTGGNGGVASVGIATGGGGGGGGYFSGGGGNAGRSGLTPAGGGGGGSNYTGGLTSYRTLQGGGSTTSGSVSFTWVDPGPAKQPPSIPTDIKINGKDYTDGMGTRSATYYVLLEAKSEDSNDPKEWVATEVVVSTSSNFSTDVRPAVSSTDYWPEDYWIPIYIYNQVPNTHYYARIYSKNQSGVRNPTYTSVDWWTDRSPTEPTLTAPAEGVTIPALSSVTFTWKQNDPDDLDSDADGMTGWVLDWRPMGDPNAIWNSIYVTSTQPTYTADPGTFKSNTFYQWTVRTRDTGQQWGPWARQNSFYVSGTTTPPKVISPIADIAVATDAPVTFTWQFRDPTVTDTQIKADIRYRAVGDGDGDWFQINGDGTTPGVVPSWTLDANTLQPGVHYEWEVRTYESGLGASSDWSTPGRFWSIVTPGSGNVDAVLPALTRPEEALGSGNNRVFVYQRGGKFLVGEITPLVSVVWTRTRDDISTCKVLTNGFGDDCGEMLRGVHTWMHELVVFRDGVRVWEGPITSIADDQDGVTFRASDCMMYVYRRILRQGYNDAYRVVNGAVLGQFTVVERSRMIAVNALAPDDPNVLPYLTTLNFPDDAGQSRVVPPYSRTAWEEIDDMAATSGLDYTTVGRRIVLWDTHRPIGRLPEMRQENFSDQPILTEYGMQLATGFAVTNNNGVWGAAVNDPGPYGLVEQLASAYGETQGGDDATLTSAALASLQQTLGEQALRNIAHRYPAPVQVRIPDNSQLMPDTNVTINQLVPGVWLPLRIKGYILELAQWQKLDLVTVSQDKNGEKVTVTMSPAPNSGEDPDSDAAAIEGA